MKATGTPMTRSAVRAYGAASLLLGCLTLVSSVHGQATATPPAEPGATATRDAARRPEVTPERVDANEETVQLSPFEVTADTTGYYAANTMSGTRFNTKLEDLAASISVVTKEQMEDFAMLDINDVFLYTANAEGTGTYTALTVDRNGSVADDVQLNPTQANRIRGVSAANVSLGNIETMGRVPVDPMGIDRVEISRGPNANVFGLGEPSGTVNMVPASANVQRNRSQVGTRVDSTGGYRATVDFNRVLKDGALAIRGTGVFQHDAFERKPSGTDTVRYNLMLKVVPFKSTSITASLGYYHMEGRRPNFSPPRDSVSYWIASGRPGWDPVTQTIHVNGTTLGPFNNAAGVPDYFTTTYTGSGRNQVYIDRDGLAYWGTPTANSGTTPTANAQNSRRLLSATPAAGTALGKFTGQPLFTTTPTVSDRNIYDWTSINLASVNWAEDETLTSAIQIEQFFINTPKQTLAAQVGFLREDSERYQRTIIGDLNANGQSGQLLVDVNEFRIDGTPNPFFGRPYLGIDQPFTTENPSTWDTYRAQLAYRHDFTSDNGWTKWLGMHQVSGYYEYKSRIRRRYAFKDALADNHAWIAANTARGNQGGISGGPGAAPNITRGYFRYYLGDNQGTNVDYAPGEFEYGVYPFVWGNATTGVFNAEPALLTQVATTDRTGGGNNVYDILKTEGVVVQSHFWNGRIVTTFGIREDEIFTKFGSTPQLLVTDPAIGNGLTAFDYDSLNGWAGDWRSNNGTTKQRGVVVRPFRDLAPIRRASEEGGVMGSIANALNGMSLFYNWSDSFTPQSPAQDLNLQPLPNSSGVGKDWGIGLNLFDGKLVVRINRYENTRLNARNGDANTIAQRVLRHDVSSADPFQLHNRAFDWVAEAHPEWDPATPEGADLIENEVAIQIGMPRDLQAALRSPSPPLAATNDITAKGTEIEVNYNPSRAWTLAASFTDTQSINSNVSSSIQDYIDARMPLWTTIVDPRFANDPNPAQRLWWTHVGYGGSQTAAQNFSTFVENPYRVLREEQGKSSPQIRRYKARISTNFRLAGITENKLLQKFNVGGALRWEDKAAIGYLGVQSLPDVITELDRNKPVYDEAQTYIDMFVGFRTKIWGDKVSANFQLNVRNLTEGGHLQPIRVYPDGTPHTYRIVDPRQFILQATFDM